MEIFSWLNNSKIVSDFSIKDLRKSDTAYYMNLRILFSDNSVLFVRDYIDFEHRKYSFHWQDAKENLILRWDNAPHFQDLTTFPHHKHLPSGEVLESHNILLEEILEVIEGLILP